jgi:hypothetical protein
MYPCFRDREKKQTVGGNTPAPASKQNGADVQEQHPVVDLPRRRKEGTSPTCVTCAVADEVTCKLLVSPRFCVVGGVDVILTCPSRDHFNTVSSGL